MKKMKKTIALIASCVLLCSGVLSGCKSGKTETETSKQSETVPQTTTEKATTTTSESVEETIGTVPVFKDLDKDWFEKTEAYYLKQYPERDHGVYVLADGIRGYGIYGFSENMYAGPVIDLSYYSTEYGNDIGMMVYTNTETVSVNVELQYDDNTRYVTNGFVDIVGLKEIEKYIDDLIDGKEGYFDVVDDSALAAHSEEIKKDIAILYSRLIKMSDSSFSEINLTMEDGGISFGKKYREVDPTQTLSMEVVLENEHQFKNGVCSDCGMKWTEYYYDAIGKLARTEDVSEGWRSFYGQTSKYMFSLNDYVQYSATEKTYAEMLYYMNDEEDKVGRTFKFTFDGSGKKTIVNCEFNLEQGKVSLGDGVFSYQFMYSATLNAAPGEWDAVFASKEAFAKGCMVSLYIRDSENGGYTNAWAEMSEGDIKKQFESVEGCKYYTREEIADMLWDLHEAMLKSLDAGMADTGTNLADAGVNWKAS